MILRPNYFLAFTVLNIIHAQADSIFDCHVTIKNIKFDLTSLAGEHVLNRTRETPPTTMVDSFRFNLCAELDPQGDLSEQDQVRSALINTSRYELEAHVFLVDRPYYEFPKIKCAIGTRACMTKTNKKPNEEDRIISIIPIAQTSTLKPTYDYSLGAQQLFDFFPESLQPPAPKFISLLLNGPDYPSPLSSSPTPQSLNMTVLCNPSETADPEFIAYDGSRLDVEWRSPAGCPFQGDDNKDDEPKDDKKEEDKTPESHKSIGSGLGWFFLACVICLTMKVPQIQVKNSIFLCLATYFGLGAYYNYSTYGARGVDLIPWVSMTFSFAFPLTFKCLPRHRDFWKEVPYMLSDVVSHLCSNIRPRRTSSRGGYISV